MLFAVDLFELPPRIKGTGVKTDGVIGAVRHSGFISLEHATSWSFWWHLNCVL